MREGWEGGKRRETRENACNQITILKVKAKIL